MLLIRQIPLSYIQPGLQFQCTVDPVKVRESLGLRMDEPVHIHIQYEISITFAQLVFLCVRYEYTTGRTATRYLRAAKIQTEYGHCTVDIQSLRRIFQVENYPFDT